jgi:hypothetical protein
VPQPAPSSAPENEDVSDSVVQLKGHEAEVCDHAAGKLTSHLISNYSGLRLCLEPYPTSYIEFRVGSA